MKRNIWLGIMAFWAVACSTDKLDTWEEKGRVWFTSADMVVASFKSQPGDEIIAEIPLSMAGRVEKSDRVVNVEVVKDKRNPTTRYEILSPVVIKADSTTGVLKVKVYKTDNLAEKADTLNLALRGSSDLEVGYSDYSECTLLLTNRYTRPWWWYDYALGTYTQDKHDYLFIILGSDDDLRGEEADENFRRNWTKATALYNLYLLNKYCEDHNLSFRYKEE